VAVAEGYTSAQQIHDAFYAGLGKLIEDTRRGGSTEFIVQGDFNATVTRGVSTRIRLEDKQLTAWCEKHGLVIVEFKEGSATPTFHANRGRDEEGADRQLDIILVSMGLVKLECGVQS
jgi:hypothetical protein